MVRRLENTDWLLTGKRGITTYFRLPALISLLILHLLLAASLPDMCEHATPLSTSHTHCLPTFLTSQVLTPGVANTLLPDICTYTIFFVSISLFEMGFDA